MTSFRKSSKLERKSNETIYWNADSRESLSAHHSVGDIVDFQLFRAVTSLSTPSKRDRGIFLPWISFQFVWY